jgi:hypothetical protein
MSSQHAGLPLMGSEAARVFLFEDTSPPTIIESLTFDAVAPATPLCSR